MESKEYASSQCGEARQTATDAGGLLRVAAALA